MSQTQKMFMYQKVRLHGMFFFCFGIVGSRVKKKKEWIFMSRVKQKKLASCLVGRPNRFRSQQLKTFFKNIIYEIVYEIRKTYFKNVTQFENLKKNHSIWKTVGIMNIFDKCVFLFEITNSFLKCKKNFKMPKII